MQIHPSGESGETVDYGESGDFCETCESGDSIDSGESGASGESGGQFLLHLLVGLWWDEVQNEWDRSQLFCTVYVVKFTQHFCQWLVGIGMATVGIDPTPFGIVNGHPFDQNPTTLSLLSL